MLFRPGGQGRPLRRGGVWAETPVQCRNRPYQYLREKQMQRPGSKSLFVYIRNGRIVNKEWRSVIVNEMEEVGRGQSMARSWDFTLNMGE